MINLTSLSINLDFKPDKSPVKGVLRGNGYTEFKDDDETTETLQLNIKDFRITIYIPHYEHEKPWSWDSVLPVIKEYFTLIDTAFFKPFCSHGVENVKLGLYNEIPEQSEQEDKFIANYSEWIFLQFDRSFETLFSIDPFEKLLNNKYHTHQVMDQDWPQTKMFLNKEFTVEDLSSIRQVN